MTIYDVDILKLLPGFIRDDRTARAYAGALNPILQALAASIGNLRLNVPEGLSENVLDSLAESRNVLWYDRAASLEIKRDLVKNSLDVFWGLGTKWAIERVATDYFGDAAVEEWFEYGGEPHHFRITTSSVEAERNNGEKLKAAIELVKRCSAVLDGVYVSVVASASLCAGGAASAHDDVYSYLTY